MLSHMGWLLCIVPLWVPLWRGRRRVSFFFAHVGEFSFGRVAVHVRRRIFLQGEFNHPNRPHRHAATHSSRVRPSHGHRRINPCATSMQAPNATPTKTDRSDPVDAELNTSCTVSNNGEISRKRPCVIIPSHTSPRPQAYKPRPVRLFCNSTPPTPRANPKYDNFIATVGMRSHFSKRRRK